MIRFVFFDLGNVLVNFSHWRACEQLSTLTGLAAPKLFEIIFESDDVIDYECGRIDEIGFWNQFIRASQTRIDFHLFHQAFNQIFELNQPMIDLAQNLNQKQIPISILSNTCSGHWNYVRESFPVIDQLFGSVILSYKVGVMKPDPLIYQAAIELSGCQPSEIFFVDDRLENVAGAQSVGIDAELFVDATRFQQQLETRRL